MVPPGDDHDCGWKAYAEHQSKQLEELKEQLEALKRQVFGKKTEKRKLPKLPPPLPAPSSTPEQAKTRRQENKLLRDAKLETEVTHSSVCRCEKCGSTNLTLVTEKPSVVYEYVQPHFRKRLIQRAVARCDNGHLTTAPGPARVGEKTQYAPSFLAHLATAKCRDSIPLYTLEKGYKSIGVPISRSTMTDLLQRVGQELAPLYQAALEIIREALDVHADETSMRQQDLTTKAYIWTFICPELTVYRYATTRSGSVPMEVLGDSKGRLVVDAYTGYNKVTSTGQRIRAGCLAHARRGLFAQRENPGVDAALDLITSIYKVEREAKDAGIAGSPAHLELRRTRSRPLFARLLCWARQQKRIHDDSSAMGKAVRYLTNNFRELGCFLDFATIPPDNNKAEGALRRVAKGRANFLFVGSEKAGHNLATVYTLVASCEQNRIDPIAYLTDVLIRVQHHPASKVRDLLPHQWKPSITRNRS